MFFRNSLFFSPPAFAFNAITLQVKKKKGKKALKSDDPQ